MAPRTSSRVAIEEDEFPLLTTNGLTIRKTLGDGNCLFRALSDQLYGHDENHLGIRREVVEYMRTHPDEFKPFFSVGPQRRYPKRRGAAAGHVDTQEASDTELEKVFQAHLKKMSRPREWGTQSEVTAFVKAFKVDVTVWCPTWKTTLHAVNGRYSRNQSHIAFNGDACHYSSVRNVNGPFYGLPAITYVDEESRIDLLRKTKTTKQRKTLAGSPAVVLSGTKSKLTVRSKQTRSSEDRREHPNWTTKREER
ncbi:hypothetical protein SBOR_4225 [Sclerotinia borealis F-4128]|uniref:OTU domain-containing protein n=1 Tax=Sclerotinia borealis (strain F-4128) TaxID=1432307 RepID=W9CL60_SCLBF|nr:hypothetical protein SBOR_4225 [Sclerotinia borealis F-4128]